MTYFFHKLYTIIPLRSRLHSATINSIDTSTPHVHTVRLKLSDNKSWSYQPGQFLFVKFLNPQITGEWHPFTISSSPTEPDLTISMKESGDWTSTLGALNVGDKALIQAPFGWFSFVNFPSKNDLVFIAGGIGITPLRSMLKYIADKNIQRRVTLLYSNKRADDIAFRSELDEIAKQHPNITVHHILSRDPNWTGATGHIDLPYLQAQIDDPIHKEYFVCGPPQMMQAIKHDLLTLGVPKHQIHMEEFSLK